MFDPREEQPDRLPNVKIPHARTEAEHKANEDRRKQLEALHRSGPSSSSVFTTEKGVKRQAQSSNSNHLPSFMRFLPPQTEKNPTTGNGSKTSVSTSSAGSSRKAKENSGKSIGRLKIQPASANAKVVNKAPQAEAAVDLSPPTDNKGRAEKKDGGAVKQSSINGATSHAGSDGTATAAALPKAGLKRKAGEEQESASKRRSTSPAPSNKSLDSIATAPALSKEAMNLKADEEQKDALKDSKTNSAPSDATSGGLTTATPISKAIIKRKSEEGNSGAVKRCKTDLASSAVTIENGTTNAVTPVSSKAIIQFSLVSEKKLEHASGGELCEKASNLGSPAKPPSQALPGAASGIDCSKTQTEDVSLDSCAPKDTAATECNPVRAEEGRIDSAPLDNTISPGTPTTTPPPDSTTCGEGLKRQADDEIASPSKKRKVESSNSENCLSNFRQACYQNASLQLLQTIPNLAALKNESSDEIEADNILSESEMKAAASGGKTRLKDEARGKLRDHLRSKAERKEL